MTKIPKVLTKLKIILILTTFCFNLAFAYDKAKLKQTTKNFKKTYLGSSYILSIEMIDTCFGFTKRQAFTNTYKKAHFAKILFCDQYNDATQEYLTQQYSLSYGVSLFKNHIYRNSLFGDIYMGLMNSDVTNIFNGKNSSVKSILLSTTFGYQHNTKRGYVYSISIVYDYAIVLKYKKTDDDEFNNFLSDGDTMELKTILAFGWRF